jgi:hypothetical protein
MVHFDVWLALVLFKRCPGEVSFEAFSLSQPEAQNLQILGFFRCPSVRHVWKGPRHILLIGKWFVLLHLVVWDRLTLVNVDMRELCNTTFATDQPKPNFYFSLK